MTVTHLVKQGGEMNKLKYYTALVLFYVGHIHSRYFPDCLFSYTVYNWCMTKSWLLDIDGQIWKLPNKEK